MQRFATLKSFSAAIALCLAGQTHAATYAVDEILSGTFSVVSVGVSSFEVSHALTLGTLISGDASLFTASVDSFVTSKFDSQAGPTFCFGTCTFTETLRSGETIYGDVSFNSFSLSDGGLQASYSGTLLITGGTGRFSGATGGGTFSGVDSYLTSSTGTTQHRSIYTVTTVPEPVSYSMLLAGLLVVSGVRRKNL